MRDANTARAALAGAELEAGEKGSSVVLHGLDGGTPLGFLAGLGVQRVLAEEDRAAEDDRSPWSKSSSPRLSWTLLDAWRPVLHGSPSFDDVVEAVLEDARAWESASILRFRYIKLEKKGPRLLAGLKAPLPVLRQWLGERSREDDERSLDYACALMCETATDTLDKAVPLERYAERGIKVDMDAPANLSSQRTFFDFTARNAQFLDQVEAIRSYLNRDVIAEGLRSGREDRNAPRSMDWDPCADTPGAIYTGYSRGFLPLAEWLAFRGLVWFPLASEGSNVRTTACSGRRLDGHFVWPLWKVPVSLETARSLVAHPGLAGLNGVERDAFGIEIVLRAGLTKKADGYSGMFSPSQPV